MAIRGMKTVTHSFVGLLQWGDYLSEGFTQTPDADANHYDFVVVGGGSAGCVVAARLSENPMHRVLLLEAGGNPHPLSIVPLTGSLLHNHPSADWQYATVPLNNSQFPLGDRKLPWPRGKMLGGCSSINYMVYMRGNPKDYDEWANKTCDPRWSYTNVEKYFKKMEDYHGSFNNHENFHSTNGPVTVEPIKYAPGLKNLLQAVKETGYRVRDLNAYQKEGFSPLEVMQKRGRRMSSYTSYIEPILKRKNLKILRYAHVTKIHLDSKLKATGVSFVRNGRTSYVTAKKEVIISAGTINSAQLLLLSGIGPQEHLRSVGIKPLVELPVGKNLQDHVMSHIGPIILNDTSTSFMPFRDLSLKSLVDYYSRGSGPLTSPMGMISVGVTSTSTSAGWPNILYIIGSMGVTYGSGEMADDVYRTGNHFTQLSNTFIGQAAHTAFVALGKPKSRGIIELRDKNPFSKPLIDPKYYSDEGNQDMLDMIEGYETIVKLYEKSDSLGRKLGARIVEIPSCAKYGFKTKAYYECAIRTPILHMFHPVGSCAMGKIGDADSVVDSQLRVIGTKGLRVIDASIMPTITNANTYAPTILIGEVGADLIKSSYVRNLMK
ncbi:Glucose dehydrogenase [FAD, quinone] [Orchesella cincta]|uniref:Glucose dehydrogenase [FAD, quinone] n=1 Tax=Orchesella cincta TaxID=48709 RepID=A0A1D2N0A4_ORCCI|nr:Glucose dehydrogenase [FAD, quinone] [Orchesella cincta]